MAEALTYWDPKNLFQIANDDQPGKVQCIGLDRRGLRCKWEIGPAERSSVYAILQQMSRRKPGDVSATELANLAPLCLCYDFHRSQSNALTTRWTTVLGTATRHYNLASQQQQQQQQQAHPLDRFARELTPESEEAISLKLDLLKARNEIDELGRANHDLKRDLENEREEVDASAKANKSLRKDLTAAQNVSNSAHLSLAAMEERNGRLASESAHLQEQIQLHIEQKSSLEARTNAFEAEAAKLSRSHLVLEEKILELQARLQTAEDGLESRDAQLEEARRCAETLRAESDRLSKESTERATQLQAAEDGLQTRNTQVEETQQHVETLRAESDRLKAENATATDRIARLETDSAATKSETRRLLAELEASRQAERQSRAELGDEQRTKATLSGQLETVRARVSILEGSIAACWLHGFCGRVNRIRRSRKRDPMAGTPAENGGPAQPEEA